MGAVIYTRTLTRTGTDLGVIQRQPEQCQAFAAGHGWEIVREEEVRGASAE